MNKDTFLKIGLASWALSASFLAGVSLFTLRKSSTINNLYDDILRMNEDLLKTKDQNLIKHFKTMTTSNYAPLTDEEIERLKLGIEENHPKPGLENICKVYTVAITPEQEVPNTIGNCIFLTPTLILTNYHILENGSIDYFFPMKRTVKDGKGNDYKLEGAIATSELYDLALIRTNSPNTNTKPVSLSYSSEEAKEVTMISCGNGDKTTCSYLSEKLRVTGREDRYYLDSLGNLCFPSLSVTPFITEGHSGSPIFEGDNLIGILSYGIQKDNTSFITDRVYKFISLLIEDKPSLKEKVQ